MLDREALRKELAIALGHLRRSMAEVAREGDREAYRRLADRYARARARWERLGTPQVGPQERAPLTSPAPRRPTAAHEEDR